MIGADQRGQHDQQEQPEGKAGDRVLAENVAGVAQSGAEPGIVPRLGRGALARQGDVGHASTLMRGSITP